MSETINLADMKPDQYANGKNCVTCKHRTLDVESSPRHLKLSERGAVAFCTRYTCGIFDYCARNCDSFGWEPKTFEVDAGDNGRRL